MPLFLDSLDVSFFFGLIDRGSVSNEEKSGNADAGADTTTTGFLVFFLGIIF